jgi:hypothetical protein
LIAAEGTDLEANPAAEVKGASAELISIFPNAGNIWAANPTS